MHTISPFRWPLWNYTSLHLRSKVQGQLSKVSKAKISVTSMKLHFITFEVKGPRSISRVNYPKYLKQKFWWPLWNYTSLHLRSKVQGQLSKVSKAKMLVTSMKLHFITFEVKGPRSISKTLCNRWRPESGVGVWVSPFAKITKFSYPHHLSWHIVQNCLPATTTRDSQHNSSFFHL